MNSSGKRDTLKEGPDRRVAATLLAALCAVAPAAATAQSGGPPPEPAVPVASGVLEPVTVVGKRQQRRRDVAGTVDFIEGGELEERAARDQEDLFKLTPGVQFNKGHAHQALPTIRGIGTVGSSDVLGTQQATTGFYVEDLPFSDPFGFVGNPDIALFDLQRVELLRGPQGALYGSASLGGAVNYVFNKPDLKDMHSSVLMGVGAMRGGGTGRSLDLMLNAPVKEDVAGIRLVAFGRHDAGYITNLGTGQERANGLRQSGGRIVGLLQPASGVSVMATVLTQRTENDDSFAVSPDPQQLTRNTPTASWRRNEFSLGKLHLDMALGDGHSLTAIGGVIDKRAFYVSDSTRSNEALGAYYGPLLGVGELPALRVARSLSERPLWSHAVSQELRITSGGERALHYVAGALVQRTRFDWRGISVAPQGQSLWGPAGALLPNDQIGAIDIQARTTETAVFADSEYRLRNGVSLGLGGRAYRTTLRYGGQTTFLGRSAPLQAANSERGFTPKLSAKYSFGEHQVHVLASKGYRFGGVNLNPPQMTPYRSDSLWNYEAGLRLVPAAGLRLDLTAFALEWKNAQVSTLLAGPVPFIGVANVGQARSRGVEAALNWQPLRGLELLAGAAYTDARTTAAFTASSGALVPANARLPGTARWQSTLQATYAFEGPAASTGRLMATHTFVGPRVFDVEGRGRAAGYSLLDVRLAFAKGPWEASAALGNVFDSRGVGGAAVIYRPRLVSYVDYYVVKPRQLMIQLRHDY
jgi:iron complex outermembrane recepter protein